MQNLFARNIDETRLDLWQPSQYTSYQSIDIGNRYFTGRKDDLAGNPIPFKHGIDPQGKLTGMAGRDLFHGDDNEVCYFGRVAGKKE